MKKKHTTTSSIAFIIIFLFTPAIHQGILGNTTESAADTTATGPTVKPNKQQQKFAIITEPKGAKIEKEFDKIRRYDAYDPTTKSWSAIEDFKTVEMLTDTTQKRPDDYIYYSFWAYDPLTEQWKRVDIRGYGYLIPDDKKPFKFWKNFGVSFSVGGGGTYYKNTTEGFNLLLKKGEGVYVLQPKNIVNKLQGKGYRIKWFGNTYAKITNLKDEGVIHDQNSLEEITTQNIPFTGMGVTIPIMLHFHYTFLKRLRVGAGANLAINRLSNLTVEQITYSLEKPWFFNFKWFGSIAYNVFRQGLHRVFVDTQLGMVYDLGNEPIENFTKFISNTFYGSLGITHERRLNGFLSFFYRLSGELKQYNHTDEFYPDKASVKLLQPALILEAGITINFGRKKLPIDQTETPLAEPITQPTPATDATAETPPTATDSPTDTIAEATPGAMPEEQPAGTSMAATNNTPSEESKADNASSPTTPTVAQP